MVLLLPSGRLVLLSTHKRSENLITNWSVMLNCMLLSGCNYLLSITHLPCVWLQENGQRNNS